MARLFTWLWLLGITIAFLGVILVRLVSVQVTPPYQIWVRFLGYLFSGMGLMVIALGVKRVSQKI